MVKDVFSVLLFCTVGFLLIMLCAEFVNRLGKVLPQDPEVISVTGTVIAKRDEKKLGGSTYYVTFAIEGDERIELSAAGEQYGMLIPGDRVEVSYQVKQSNQEKKLVDFNRL